MPEAAIDENERFPGAQHDVRPTRKVLGMQAVAEPRGMQDAADGKLGAGILTLDATHHRGAFGSSHTVSHCRYSSPKNA